MKIMMNAALDELTDGQLQRVQAVSEENQIVVARTREEQLAQTPDVDIIFGSFNQRLFDAAKQLKWVQTESAPASTPSYSMSLWRVASSLPVPRARWAPIWPTTLGPSFWGSDRGLRRAGTPGAARR